MKKINLEQVGWVVGGRAFLKFWDGDEGSVMMDETVIKGEITRKKLLAAVNDGGFGCQSIIGAEIDIWELYGGGHRVYRTSIETDERYTEQYLDWRYLNSLK